MNIFTQMFTPRMNLCENVLKMNRRFDRFDIIILEKKLEARKRRCNSERTNKKLFFR